RTGVKIRQTKRRLIGRRLTSRHEELPLACAIIPRHASCDLYIRSVDCGTDPSGALFLLENRFHKAVFDSVAMGNGESVLRLVYLRRGLDSQRHCAIVGSIPIWRQ